MNPFSLKGTVALVTGGAMNIGRGLVEGLARAGAQVAIGYHSHREEAEGLADQLGECAQTIAIDVASSESIETAFDAVGTQFGGLDILINNAGIFSLHPQSELEEDEWDRIFRVNMRGIFLASKAAATLLEKRGGGSIINIASINGFHPGFGHTAHYDASKGAVIAYTRSLAAELAPKKIRVNGIAPGLVDAPDLREHFADLATMVETRTPLGELTQRDEIAQLAVFLASRASRQITGETIVIDGGYLLT